MHLSENSKRQSPLAFRGAGRAGKGVVASLRSNFFKVWVNSKPDEEREQQAGMLELRASFPLLMSPFMWELNYYITLGFSLNSCCHPVHEWSNLPYLTRNCGKNKADRFAQAPPTIYRAQAHSSTPPGAALPNRPGGPAPGVRFCLSLVGSGYSQRAMEFS